MDRPGSTAAHPILYALLGLVTLNLMIAFGTLILVAVRGGGASRAPDATRDPDLPAHLTREQMDQIAEDLVEKYNAEDWDSMYASFDQVLRLRAPREQLIDQLQELRRIFGSVREFAFSHANFHCHARGGDVFALWYAAELEGGSFPKAMLRIEVIDRGDHCGIAGFFMNAEFRWGG